MKLLVSRLAPDQLDELRALAPAHTILHCPTPEEVACELPEAEAFFGFITRDLIAAAPKLRWVQVPSAGVETCPFELLAERGLTLTNAKGLYGPQLAEHAMAFVLAFNRNFHKLFARQREEVWESRANLAEHELAGETLLIVGLGGIGLDLAWRAHAWKLRVIAVSKHHKPRPDFVARLSGMERLHEFLGEADYVVVCCALTPETRKLFGAREFAAMKPGAYFVNVTRGGIVDTDALVAALQQGQLAGAGLDVTDPEPLPPGHPLWRMDNVLLTPHTSGQSPHADARLFELLKENVRRFLAAEPLLNQVDLRLAY